MLLVIYFTINNFFPNVNLIKTQDLLYMQNNSLEFFNSLEEFLNQFQVQPKIFQTIFFNFSALTNYLHYRKIIGPSNIVLNDSHFAFRTRIIFLIWFWRYSDSSSAIQSQCLTFPTLLRLSRSWYISTSSWVLYFVKCCIFWSALVLCLISYHNNLMTLGKSFLSCVL